MKIQTQSSLLEQSALLASWWKESKNVLIGAGAGLSAAAGIDYTDQDDFKKTFPALAKRGFRARYQFIGYDRWWPEQHWAYWATHVENVRFQTRTHPVYTQLFELLQEKDYFILTTNVDGMFARHGFDEARWFTPQGDYASLQCRKPCRRVVWPSQPVVKRALASVDPVSFEVTDPDAIPCCPYCGGEVFFNVRADHSYVEEPYHEQQDKFEAWLQERQDEPILLVEIGAGFNTPTLIRWPMEKLAAQDPKARLVRINRDHSELPPSLVGHSLSFAEDAALPIERLWSQTTHSSEKAGGSMQITSSQYSTY